MGIYYFKGMSKVVDNKVTIHLKKYKESTVSEIKDHISDFATDVEISATRDAPNFLSIDKKFENGGLSAEVGVMGGQMVGENQSSGYNIAAYWEFGTGLSAAEITAGYPQWVKDKAMEYYVSGKGTLIGSPYLFNNFLAHIPTFERKVRTSLDENKR